MKTTKSPPEAIAARSEDLLAVVVAGRDRKLELTAAYDKVSDDEMLQDGRFVADLTWVENLGEALAQAIGGSEFVATLVWANKPEFRGEVDEDFGLRAGLKWSLGDGKK